MNKAVFYLDQDGLDCQGFRDDADHLDGPEGDPGGAVIDASWQSASHGV